MTILATSSVAAGRFFISLAGPVISQVKYICMSVTFRYFSGQLRWKMCRLWSTGGMLHQLSAVEHGNDWICSDPWILSVTVVPHPSGRLTALSCHFVKPNDSLSSFGSAWTREAVTEALSARRASGNLPKSRGLNEDRAIRCSTVLIQEGWQIKACQLP